MSSPTTQITLSLTDDQLNKILPTVKELLSSENDVTQQLLSVQRKFLSELANTNDPLKQFLLKEQMEKITLTIETLKLYVFHNSNATISSENVPHKKDSQR